MADFKCKDCNLSFKSNFNRIRHESICKVKKQKILEQYKHDADECKIVSEKYKILAEEYKDKLDYCLKYIKFSGLKLDLDNRIDFDALPYIFSKSYLKNWAKSIDEIDTVADIYSPLILFHNKPIYWLGDKHRYVFYFRDKAGNIIRDDKCKKLRKRTRDILETRLIELSRPIKSPNTSDSSDSDSDDLSESDSDKEIDVKTSILNKIDSKNFPKLIASIKGMK